VSRDRALTVGTVVLCGLLIAAGAALRLTHINWDQFQHVHPDERFIVWVADTISWPKDLGSALDPARSTINPFRWPPNAGDLAGQPRGYAYGHFPLYLLVIVAHVAQSIGLWIGETTLALPPVFQPLYVVGRHLAEYGYLALVGRAISALCDLGTLTLIYALGRRVFGRAAGLIAAGAYAFAVLPIQLSHFYAVDMVLTLCVVATVALAARWAETGARWSWLLAGVTYGLAVGSKFSAILLLLPLLAAALHRLPAAGRRYRLVARRMAPVLGLALFTFALTNPFAILEFPAYARNLLAQNAMVSGVMDAPYTRQYIGTIPYWYFIQQLSQWGLGWPLGLVGWAGLAWAVLKTIKGRSNPALSVILAWALPYFFLTGAFHAKFLRYMAPLVPFLLICAAGMIVDGYRWAAARWGGRGRFVWAVAVSALLVFTAGWALVFTGVYRQEHPWIQASRWIFRNMPEGSHLLTEHWDDALPLAMDEITPRIEPRDYVRVELPLYDPDTPAKLDSLVGELSSADYLIIASNRLYAPIQRLPRRYPMTSQYYRLLFSGGLGYQQVATFSDYPHLDGLIVRDDHADESFTVYDHPRVMIFENVERLKPELLRARLERYLPQGTAVQSTNAARSEAAGGSVGFEATKVATPKGPMNAAYGEDFGRSAGYGATAEAQVLRRAPGRARYVPRPQEPLEQLRDSAPKPWPVPGLPLACVPQAGQAAPVEQALVWATGRTGCTCGAGVYHGQDRPSPDPSTPGPPLMLSQPVDTLPVVADFRWNRFASEHTLVAVVLWWFVLSLLGWLAWPIIFPLMGGLRDRGYGLARTVGWALVGWIHWLGSSLWQNRAEAIGLVVAGLAAVGLVAWRLQRQQIRAFRAQRRRLLLGEEALFAMAFLLFAGIRVLNPDLWQPWNGGEKFMEFAFLNATLRSAHFPPYDPYFAGGIINYYYYGLYLVSLLIKLTGIASEVAFNLAVPGLFALTATGLFSVGASLAARTAHGRSEASDMPTDLPAARSANDLAAWPRDNAETLPLNSIGASPGDNSKVLPVRRRGGSPYIAASLGILLALLMSNLSGFTQLFDHFVRLGGGSLDAGASLWGRLIALVRGVGQLLQGVSLARYDYWAPSRVIPFTINEFPFWTFLFADLHPHLVVMPFGVLAVGLTLNWVLTAEALPSPSPPDATERGGRAIGSNAPLRRLQDVFKVGLIIISLGVIVPTNTWDLPAYWCLVMGGLVLAGWRRRRLSSLVGSAVLACLVGALAVVAYWPFYAHYQARVGSGGSPGLARYLGWTRAASPPGSWLTVWGFFIFLALSFTVPQVWKWLRAGGQASKGKRAAILPEMEIVQRLEAAHLQDDLRLFAATEETDAVQSDQAPESAALRRRPRLWLVGLLALAGLVALLIAVGRPTAALAVVPLGLALALTLRARTAAQDAFAYWLLALGMAIVAGVEVIYLRDFLDGGEWYRMNTVFKFSMPAWLFLGLAGGVILGRAWNGARFRSGSGSPAEVEGDEDGDKATIGIARPWLTLWWVATASLLAASSVFLFFGTVSRVQDRFPGARPPLGTLDGTAYMTVGKYTWPNAKHVIDLAYDYLAIHWLLDHVSGTPVMAEAPAGSYVVDGESVGYDYYRAGGLRVASMTGFPTFVGQHQYEQRSGDQVGERTAQGQEFFITTDIARARELMRDLHVDYIYVGQLERILFRDESLRKFDVMVDMGDLEVVYQNPQVIVYRVAGSGK
jgi:YYY domain-containing protein